MLSAQPEKSSSIEIDPGETLLFFGGVYSNYLALVNLLESTQRTGIRQLFCLGDLGAFGPFPDRTIDYLRQTAATVIQGNYDHSIGNDLADCQCGYTDPRDNYFARLSYDYTFRNTSAPNKKWLGQLPVSCRLSFGGYRLLLCHGSPRRMNEFLWETTTSNAFLLWLFDCFECDAIVGTHTGLPWHREVARPGEQSAHFINCGAIGRPPNDGTTTVVYTTVKIRDGCFEVEFSRLPYPHFLLAEQMREEGLPDEFVETIETGWWTTCNEILPGKERARGRF